MTKMALKYAANFTTARTLTALVAINEELLCPAPSNPKTEFKTEPSVPFLVKLRKCWLLQGLRPYFQLVWVTDTDAHHEIPRSTDCNSYLNKEVKQFLISHFNSEILQIFALVIGTRTRHPNIKRDQNPSKEMRRRSNAAGTPQNPTTLTYSNRNQDKCH